MGILSCSVSDCNPFCVVFAGIRYLTMELGTIEMMVVMVMLMMMGTTVKREDDAELMR